MSDNDKRVWLLQHKYTILHSDLDMLASKIIAAVGSWASYNSGTRVLQVPLTSDSLCKPLIYDYLNNYSELEKLLLITKIK